MISLAFSHHSDLNRGGKGCMVSFQRVFRLPHIPFCIKELVEKKNILTVQRFTRCHLVNSSSGDTLLKHLDWLESFEDKKKQTTKGATTILYRQIQGHFLISILGILALAPVMA